VRDGYFHHISDAPDVLIVVFFPLLKMLLCGFLLDGYNTPYAYVAFVCCDVFWGNDIEQSCRPQGSEITGRAGGDVAEVEQGSFVVGDDLDAECMGVVFMVVGVAVAQPAGDDRAVDDGLNSRVDAVDAWWVNDQVVEGGGGCGDRAAYRGLGGAEESGDYALGDVFFPVEEGDVDAAD